MKPAPLVCWLLVLACDASAHRLDEYLQATRISVATNRIDLSLELTPGVAVVDQLLVVIDQNHDGQVSEKEAAVYAQRVLKDMRVELDKKVLEVRLVDNSFPALHEIRTGLGVIRIKATASLKELSADSHALDLTNTHLPAISVYLVNALAPKDNAIKITKQTRDELQRNYRLEFRVSLSSPAQTSSQPER